MASGGSVDVELLSFVDVCVVVQFSVVNMEPLPQPTGSRGGPAHPFARLFHLLFKIAAIVFYLVCELIGSKDFVTNFVVLLVFVSADFWVVKNVTGRLLVGLRWWNDVSDEGEGWRFEALDEGQRRLNVIDRGVFWGGLVGNVLGWLLLTVVTVFRISKWPYLLICVIALIMGGSNVYGFFKCSSEARRAIRNAQNALVTAAVTSAATTALSGGGNARGN